MVSSKFAATTSVASSGYSARHDAAWRLWATCRTCRRRECPDIGDERQHLEDAADTAPEGEPNERVPQGRRVVAELRHAEHDWCRCVVASRPAAVRSAPDKDRQGRETWHVVTATEADRRRNAGQGSADAEQRIQHESTHTEIGVGTERGPRPPGRVAARRYSAPTQCQGYRRQAGRRAELRRSADERSSCRHPARDVIRSEPQPGKCTEILRQRRACAAAPSRPTIAPRCRTVGQAAPDRRACARGLESPARASDQ